MERGKRNKIGSGTAWFYCLQIEICLTYTKQQSCYYTILLLLGILIFDFDFIFGMLNDAIEVISKVYNSQSLCTLCSRYLLMFAYQRLTPYLLSGREISRCDALANCIDHDREGIGRRMREGGRNMIRGGLGRKIHV